MAGGIGVVVGTGTTDELLPACVAEVGVIGLEFEVGLPCSGKFSREKTFMHQ